MKRRGKHVNYQRLREPGCQLHGKQGSPGELSWGGRQSWTCRVWIALGGSNLYPERNGVPLKVFKHWADRPVLLLHFQKEPLYLIDGGGGR